MLYTFSCFDNDQYAQAANDATAVIPPIQAAVCVRILDLGAIVG